MSLAAPEGRRKRGVSNGGGRKKGLTRSMEEEERAIYCAAERRKNWTETEDDTCTSLWY